MASLDEHRIEWSGFIGGPGVSTFYSDSVVSPSQVALHDFFDDIKTQLPDDVTIKFPPGGRVIDSATGLATGTWTEAVPQADVIGTSNQVYSGVTGIAVNWRTAVFGGGRELRGKTYLVPLTGLAFDSQGQLSTTSQATIDGAAASLIGNWPEFRVWSRLNSTVANVASATVGRKPAVLRSRRD